MTDKPLNPVAAESLSALMDGEASDFEIERLLRESGQDKAVRATWSRYQLASSVMRQQRCEPVRTTALADSVRSAIEGAPPVAATAGWRKPLGRFAVAASVAMVVVAGVQWRHAQVAREEQIAAQLEKKNPAVQMMPVASPLFASQSPASPVTVLPNHQTARDMQYPVNFTPEKGREQRPAPVTAQPAKAGE